MAKDTYLGPTSTAFVNTTDGVVFVDKGGKLPDNLVEGEADRLRNAGTPLSDSAPAAVPAPSPGPSLAEDFDDPEPVEGTVPVVTASGQVVYSPGVAANDPLLTPAEEPEPRRSRTAKG